MSIARHILKIAKNLVFDVDVKIIREDKPDHVMRKAVDDVHAYLNKVRDNEDIEVSLACSGNKDEVSIFVGVGNHEHKDAIIEGAVGKIKKSCKRLGIKIEARMMGG